MRKLHSQIAVILMTFLVISCNSDESNGIEPSLTCQKEDINGSYVLTELESNIPWAAGLGVVDTEANGYLTISALKNYEMGIIGKIKIFEHHSDPPFPLTKNQDDFYSIDFDTSGVMNISGEANPFIFELVPLPSVWLDSLINGEFYIYTKPPDCNEIILGINQGPYYKLKLTFSRKD